jgi:hypothetical protein
MTVTFLLKITPINYQEICSNQLFFECKPRVQATLRTFGDIGVFTTKDKVQGILNYKGTPCIPVGYSVHHAHNVNRMLTMETDMIINLQDITWMNEVH